VNAKPPYTENREALEREEEYLSEQVLRQMAQKNDRLMNNPDADVSSYDNEIKQFNTKLKSVREQLNNLHGSR